MSDTPRTDKWVAIESDGSETVPAHIACKLERELAKARAEIGRLEADANKWRVEAKSKNDARLNLESAAVSIKYWTNQSFQKLRLGGKQIE